VAPIGVGVAVGAGAAAGYLMREVQDYVTGSEVSQGKYDGLEAQEKHTQIKQDATAMVASNDTVITTFQNLLTNSQNAAFSNAKFAAIEQLNLGNGASTAKSEAKNEVDAYYATQQKNILGHYSVQITSIVNMISGYDASKFDANGVGFNSLNSASTDGKSKTLVDGNSYSYNGLSFAFTDSGNGSDFTSGFGISTTYTDPDQEGDILYLKPYDTGSSTEIWDNKRWADIWSQISTMHSNVVGEIETWVDGVAPNYTSGDISLDQLVNASDLANKAPDEQGFSYAGADLALLGIEGAEHNYEIELMESGQVVQGTIYAKGRSDPLELGTVYSPDSIAGTVYLAYETTDDSGNTVSDLVGLEQNFQVLEGTDSEGNSVSEVTFSSKNQQTTDTDVQKVQEELQQLQDLQDKLEKQQQQEVSSGGGGMSLDQFSIGGIPGAGVVAIVAGGALWLFGQDDN
jgi:hypothetical protein